MSTNPAPAPRPEPGPGRAVVHVSLLQPRAVGDRHLTLTAAQLGRDLVTVRIPEDVARAGLPAEVIDVVCRLLRNSIPVYTGHTGAGEAETGETGG